MDATCFLIYRSYLQVLRCEYGTQEQQQHSGKYAEPGQTPGDAVGDEWKDTGLFYFSVGYFVQLQYDGFSLPCYILFGSILLLSSRNPIFLMRDRKRDGRGRREELGIVKGG